MHTGIIAINRGNNGSRLSQRPAFVALFSPKIVDGLVQNPCSFGWRIGLMETAIQPARNFPAQIEGAHRLDDALVAVDYESNLPAITTCYQHFAAQAGGTRQPSSPNPLKWLNAPVVMIGK